MFWAVILAAACGVAPRAQSASQLEGHVAFRVDDSRVVATLRVFDDDRPSPHLGAEPRTGQPRYGYPFFALPDEWRGHAPEDVSTSDRWAVHLAAGDILNAEVEAIVGGEAQCQHAVGVLLRIRPEHRAAFVTSSARYGIAAPMGSQRGAAPGRITALAAPALVATVRTEIERQLGELFDREFPRVRSESEGDFTRIAAQSSRQREWVRQWRAVDAALAEGKSRLVYDVQRVRLSREGGDVYFVRAEWFVGRRQGFAATVWLRGNSRLEPFKTDVRPAEWLRMGEFSGRIYREHLGLVLNIVDVDGDGWREVLFSREGYEAVTLELLEYSPTGFQPTGIRHVHGC